MSKKFKMEYRPINEIKPYKNNPRKNDDAVQYVEASLREFDFTDPVIVDGKGELIAGHTRLKAAKKLGLKELPVIVRDDLTEDQIKALRIAHNKTGEFAEWDDELLSIELPEIEMDMEQFGMPSLNEIIDFGRLSDRLGEKDQEYLDFEEKFLPKHTTDDCFTPPEVYEAVKEWVLKEYGFKEEQIVRPFYPGGDFETFKYPKNCIVLDNPPFSIMSKIVKFYQEKSIPFFLFAPNLTYFQHLSKEGVNGISACANVIYENGARVSTSFLTNLGEYKFRTVPELKDSIEKAQEEEDSVELPIIDYPPNVISGARIGVVSKGDIRIYPDECTFIKKMDTNDEKEIFGGGLLISDQQAERIRQERIRQEREKIIIELSEREKDMILIFNEASEKRGIDA